jgi:hypothetical protein
VLKPQRRSGRENGDCVHDCELDSVSGDARESAGATMAIIGEKKNFLLVTLEFLILGAVSFKLPSWTKKKFPVLE